MSAIEFKRGRSKDLRFKPRGFGSSGPRGSKFDHLGEAALDLDDHDSTGDHLRIPVPLEGYASPEAFRFAIANGIQRKRDELAENWYWKVRRNEDDSEVIVTVHHRKDENGTDDAEEEAPKAKPASMGVAKGKPATKGKKAR